MNKKLFFCNHLAEWLYTSEWHYTTLLAICIDSVKNLPNDTDSLVNQLLFAYPIKPSLQTITAFLNTSVIVRAWFRFLPDKPKITRFDLHFSEHCVLVNAELPVIHTVGDLARWLGLSHGELEWLADLWRHDETVSSKLKNYHYSLSSKRHGGHRLVESPKGLLKRIQRKINDNIVRFMPMDDAAHGFRKSRNCKSHAALHVGKKYLIHFDLSDFFQNIQWSQIYNLYKRLGYTPEVSKYLAAICSHRCYVSDRKIFEQLDSVLREKLMRRHLPQGAPSSPALSNAVLIGIDKRLGGLARRLDLTYSRYADDFVFSGNGYRDWSSFISLVGSICLEQGFDINFRKTRVVRAHQKQRVTGISVNEKTNIDRAYYERLKAILTNCIRYGVRSQNRTGHSNFEEHLRGRVQHVKSLNEAKGKKLENIFREINFDC